MRGSRICIGLVDSDDALKGFARVITDYTFKAIIFDVIVAAGQRGTGLGDRLMELVGEHDELKQVKHFELYCLPEMFEFYERHGFSGDVGGIGLMRCESA